MKLLLVDDDDFLRDMYATKFSEAGHTVEVAKSGEQGLEKLKDNTYDAVIMDMVMPGITGLDFIKKVVTDKLGGEPACIVLSNQGEQADVDAAKKEGAKGYIIKAEMIPSEVVEKVEAIIAS